VLEKKHSYQVLLGGLLCLLFLLSLQPVHVRLQEVAIGQLEFVHLLGMDHCGDLLIFEDSPETHIRLQG